MPVEGIIASLSVFISLLVSIITWLVRRVTKVEKEQVRIRTIQEMCPHTKEKGY